MRLALISILFTIIPTVFADWRNYSDNPLIALGLLDPDSEFVLPEEIYITEDEIRRFAAAFVDVTVAANRATARVVLNQENKETILIEHTHHLARILLAAEMDVNRYRLLEFVVNQEPRLLDDTVRHMFDQRQDKVGLLNMPTDYAGYKQLLAGAVPYEVTREMYRAAEEQMRPSRGQQPSRGSGSMMQSILN